MLRTVLVSAVCLGLAACASIPQPLTGEYSQVMPQNAAQSQGSRVRWGGEIVETVPAADHTCIYALSRPLDSQARPQRDEDSMGRFVACREGFYDPEVFAKGRDITVTGTLQGTLTRKVGDYDYPYPEVQADTVYLWPRLRPNRSYYYRDSIYYNPFWGYGFYDPFWYSPPPVIVVPSHHPHPHPSGNN